MRQTIFWRGIFWPGHEHCAVYDEDSHWFVAGTAIFTNEDERCLLRYLIECDHTWTTRSARVLGWVGEKSIDVHIMADRDRNWLFNGSEQPPVKGCTDVDLNFSPSTNLLPIRRLNLATGQQASVSAAWLRFPNFKLERLDQTYQRLDATTYRYESNDGAFVAELKVNEFGLVENYPGLWEKQR
jgi:uncharacterized protein